MTLLRAFRILSQIVFFGLFIYLFLATTSVAHHLFVNHFFQIDPLLFLTTSIATRTVLPFVLPLILIVITLLLGRVFCSFVCPLGAMIDGFDLLVGRIKPSKIDLKYLKYCVLIFVLAISITGGALVYFFDPMMIIGRSFTGILRPGIAFFAGRHILQNGFLFLVILVVILSLSLIQKRFWCGNLCPLGAMLGVFSRLSLLRFRIKHDCDECEVCAGLCPTRAIDVKAREISQFECVRCMNCLTDCSKRKIDLGFGLPLAKVRSLDLSRRQFIASVGLGIVITPILKTEIFSKINPARVIRPPGAIPENQFLSACIRCGECIKLCPTNGLQPVIFETGVSGLFTPRLQARIGGCERYCNGCGQVCPTGAIRKLSLEEKSYARLGTAVLHKEMCLAWEQDKLCLICDEACPFNAINSRLVEIMGVKLVRPIINEELCTGCGICESRCPISGPAAIEVLPTGEERFLTGSYVTPRKEELRKALEKRSVDDVPSGFIE